MPAPPARELPLIPLPSAVSSCARLVARTAFTHFEGLVGAHPFLDAQTTGVLSPTSLEAWFACPHRYLVQHVLGIREVEDPEEIVQISALDKGNVMHRVLDRFVQDALDSGSEPRDGAPWPESDADRLEALIGEEFAAAEASGRVGLLRLWEVAGRVMREDLRNFLAKDDARRATGRLTPVASELTFGRGGVPGVEVPLGDGRTLRIRGSIDRVDEGPAGLVVTDYKTGKSKSYKNLDADKSDGPRPLPAVAPLCHGRATTPRTARRRGRGRLLVHQPPREVRAAYLHRQRGHHAGHPGRAPGGRGRDRERPVPAPPNQALGWLPLRLLRSGWTRGSHLPRPLRGAAGRGPARGLRGRDRWVHGDAHGRGGRGDGMTTLLDQPDRDRARHALDETIFVTAGAGAGKTKVLVDRICSLVTDSANPVPMRAVAAVTFTEKAAAEMRDKIRAELSKRAHDKDAGVAQRARDALDELDMAAIGTLHSFASRLLMENPIEAHLPPVIRPMDEVASSVRSERWWSQIRTVLLEGDATAEAMQVLMAAGVGLDAIRDLTRRLQADWDLVEERCPRGAGVTGLTARPRTAARGSRALGTAGR